MDDRVDKNLEEPIEHLWLLSAFLWRTDVIVRRKNVFLEDGRDAGTGLEYDAVKVIQVRVVITVKSCQVRRGGMLARTGRSPGNL